MNHKRRNGKRVLPRKNFTPMKSIGEWSKHIHKWWNIYFTDKKNYKRGDL